MPQHVISLSVTNFKKIEAAVIETGGKPVVEVAGKNAAGKSSALDAIEAALAGARAIPERPIRTGQETARIACKLDQYTVTRTFEADGTSKLIVVDAEGRSPGGQNFLDTLTGKGIAFDPLAFQRMEAPKQLETLRRLVGLDLTDLTNQIKALDKDRADKGRDVSARKKQIDELPEYPDAPTEEVAPAMVDVNGLSSQLQEAQAHNRQETEIRQRLNGKSHEIKTLSDTVANAVKQIEAWRAVIDRESPLRDAAMTAANVIEAELAAFKSIDCAPIHKQLQDADAQNRAAIQAAADTNRKVQANKTKQKMVLSFRDMKQAYEELDGQIRKIVARKGELVAAAKFPVPGLGFGENGVTFRGLPFEQASSAEQLRVSVAMALGLAPARPDAIKVLLVRDASLLDPDSKKLITDLATAADAQVWLEEVCNTDDEEQLAIFEHSGAVVMMDGTVKGTQNV